MIRMRVHFNCDILAPFFVRAYITFRGPFVFNVKLTRARALAMKSIVILRLSEMLQLHRDFFQKWIVCLKESLSKR